MARRNQSRDVLITTMVDEGLAIGTISSGHPGEIIRIDRLREFKAAVGKQTTSEVMDVYLQLSGLLVGIHKLRLQMTMARQPIVELLSKLSEHGAAW